ncbi:uncharacterized protein TRIADDRAFT_52883 [Trichoplax adhaerens]|uniref:Uncharacterized protein n=1 Tax=Trichoplax adhaerens TaxID=10228 RepID=B3RMQ2_TRIAD|nr:predicted protein [Trichoplax adhaerens]EDV27316.1 predicted protein [Trichoplax adhaerens]|eukprot:XP_002109150.1 predicted protein [Trichoplax adhaerens]
MTQIFSNENVVNADKDIVNNKNAQVKDIPIEVNREASFENTEKSSSNKTSSINNREIFNKEKRPEQSNDHDPSYQNLQESRIARNGIDSVDDCLAQERTTENIDLIEDPLARENFAEMCVCLADKQSVQERSAEEGIDLVDDGSRHCISSGEEALNLLHDNSSLLWYGKLVVESN